ncbi:MAG: hypothetical protein AAF744_15995 [Pseudomonadota bacterium]
MLKSNRMWLSATALFASLAATSAQADNHTVLVMDGGFFPAVTYTGPGDNVIFTNNSEGPVILSAHDQSWQSETIDIDATFVLNIKANTSLDFVALEATSGSAGEEGEYDAEYIALDDVLMEGALSFNEPPLENDTGS